MIALTILAALLGLHGALPGQGQLIIPFQAPDKTDQRLAQAGHLKSSLRFGYLKDNPEAQSLRERREYNAQGYPTLIYKFSPLGHVERKEEYAYDPAGTQILLATIEVFGSTQDLEELLHYRFDPAGRLLEYRRESRAEGFSGLGNTYDPNGRLLVSQHFEKDRLPGPSETYAYDAKGNCTSMTRRDLTGEVELVVEYTLNAAGKPLKETHLHQGKVLLFSYRNTFDSHGRIIHRDKVGRADEIGAWEAIKYDPKGNMIEKLTLEQGETKPMTEKNRYDSKGRLLEQKVYDTDGSLFQWFKYSHDSTGTGAGFQRLHGDGSVSMESMTKYDTQQRKVAQWTHYTDGSGSMRIDYRYDDSGLPMEEKHTDSGQEQATFWFVHERY